MKSPVEGSIEIEVGREFVIALESNQTTGYRWKLIEPLDEGILEFVENQYIVGDDYEEPEGERMGAGGEEVFTFRAVSQGTTTISLGYVRRKGSPPERTRTFTVIVRSQS